MEHSDTGRPGVQPALQIDNLPSWAREEPFGGRAVSRVPGNIDVADTGVRSLDRAMVVLAAVEAGAATLPHLVEATGLPKTTVYRLARALEAHGMLTRDAGRNFRLGSHLFALASQARRDLPLAGLAQPALDRLSQATGETAQLYIRYGDRRLCIASSESPSELRTIVPVGASLPMSAGSAAAVFLAYATQAERDRWLQGVDAPAWRKIEGVEWQDKMLRKAGQVDVRGFAWSVEDREKGVASVSAPVFMRHRGDGGAVPAPPVAVVSISGPVGRLGRTPGNHYGPAVMTAAREIERALGEPW